MAGISNEGTSSDFDIGIVGEDPIIVRCPQFGDAAHTLSGLLDPSIDETPRSAVRLASQYGGYWPISSRVNGDNWVNQGTEGSGFDLDYKATPTNNSRYFHFPNTSNNYLSVPDEAALDVTSISITVRMASVRWDNRISNQRIVSKRNAGNDGYELFVAYDSQHARLGFARGNSIGWSSSEVPFRNGETGWVRVTYDEATGIAEWFWAADAVAEPSTWTSLGTSTFSVAALAANTELLRIGVLQTGTDPLDGRIYNVIVRNAATAGSTVLNIDVPTNTTGMTVDVTTAFTATSGQTVTLTKSGSPPNTCRLITAGLSAFPRPYYASTVDHPTLEASDGTLTILWGKFSVAAYTTTKREIFPLFGIGEPYQVGSLTAFMDTFNGEVYCYGRSASGVTTSVSFPDGWGLAMAASSGVFTVMIAIYKESATSSRIYFRAYNVNDEELIYSVTLGDSSLNYLGSDLLVDPSGAFRVYGGTDIQPVDAGVVEIPATLGSDVASFLPYTTEHFIFSANGDQVYYPNEFWIATDTGTLSYITNPVQEGDLICVLNTADETGVIPEASVEWQHIRANTNPTDALYKTDALLQVLDPVVIDSAEDFFVWVIVSAAPDDDIDFFLYAQGDVGFGFAEMDLGNSDGGVAYWEMDDDAGDWQWGEFDGADFDPPRTIWDGKYSSPTLIGMSLERPSTLTGYIVDEKGLISVVCDEQPGWVPGDITLDDEFFIGSDSDSTSFPCMIVAAGFDIGTNVVPSPSQIRDLWALAVYGSAEDIPDTPEDPDPPDPEDPDPPTSTSMLVGAAVDRQGSETHAQATANFNDQIGAEIQIGRRFISTAPSTWNSHGSFSQDTNERNRVISWKGAASQQAVIESFIDTIPIDGYRTWVVQNHEPENDGGVMTFSHFKQIQGRLKAAVDASGRTDVFPMFVLMSWDERDSDPGTASSDWFPDDLDGWWFGIDPYDTNGTRSLEQQSVATIDLWIAEGGDPNKWMITETGTKQTGSAGVNWINDGCEWARGYGCAGIMYFHSSVGANGPWWLDPGAMSTAWGNQVVLSGG